MLGLLAQLFEFGDLQIQDLDLFLQVSLTALKTLNLGLGGILPMAPAGLGADLAVELAPGRIDHRNRIRNRLGSVLNQVVQAVMFSHVTEGVFLSPSGE